MAPLRLALAQVNPTVGDLAGNTELCRRRLEEASRLRYDLVVFPELVVCGYPPEDLVLKRHFLARCRGAVEAVAGSTRATAALIGFPHQVEDGVYNAAALAHGGRIVGVYHKVALPNYGVFDERRYFTPGSGWTVFEMRGLRILMTICEDIWVEGGTAERAAKRNAVDLIVNLSASPFHAGKLNERLGVFGRMARHTGTMVACCNLVGGQDELVFDGGAMVLAADGSLLAGACRFREQLLVVDLPARAGRRTGPARQLSGQWQRRIVLEGPDPAGRRPLEPPPLAVLSRLEEVFEALVLGTRDYVRKNGFRRVVVGLSGGIDSSLTAVLAVEALGAENVVGVTMPSECTSSETLADAARLAGNLGIRLLKIPIKPIFETYLVQLRQHLGGEDGGVALENLQARIRGNILMTLSNRFGWLVLTTGNKSETAVGYCTLYGDTAGGFAVIKDVPKTLVYELADLVNRRAGREVIPRSVIERPPTAELRPGQKDEDALPPYEVLDPILKAYVEDDLSVGEIVARGFDPAVVRAVAMMVDGSEYKRRQAPPGVKITPKAFGRDRRLPITNRYQYQSSNPHGAATQTAGASGP